MHGSKGAYLFLPVSLLRSYLSRSAAGRLQQNERSCFVRGTSSPFFPDTTRTNRSLRDDAFTHSDGASAKFRSGRGNGG